MRAGAWPNSSNAAMVRPRRRRCRPSASTSRSSSACSRRRRRRWRHWPRSIRTSSRPSRRWRRCTGSRGYSSRPRALRAVPEMSMSPSLTDQLFEQLQGAPLRQIAQQLGAGQAQTAGAVSAALPLLLGALGRNASQPQGADALYGALQNDFSGAGDLGGVLDAVLGGAQSRQTNGAGILGHVLGGQLPRAEAGLGQATGLGG